MVRNRLASIAWLTLFALSNGTSASPIADFTDQFKPASTAGLTRPQVSADGWDYLWNAGVIGQPSNYQSLKSWSTGYNYDGAGSTPRVDPASYVSLYSTSGHPGRGSTQTGGGNTLNRYAIAAYTIQSGGSQPLVLTDSRISVGSANSNGVDVRVFVNDQEIGSPQLQLGGVPTGNFNRHLGIVNPGDTVYVALGPHGTDGSDGFGLDFTIDTIREHLWDADGTGDPSGGTGTWNAAANEPRWANLPTGGSYFTWNNTAGYSANFGGTAGTVTLGAPVTARSLIFSTDGYEIAGSGNNAITLTNAESGGVGPATISVLNAADTATVSARIAGSAGLTKTGDGTLILTNAGNNYTGMTTVNGGVLRLGPGAVLPSGTGLSLTIGTLDLNGANASVSSLTMNGGRIATGNGTLTVTAGSSTLASYTYASDVPAAIAGKLNLSAGTHTLTVNDNSAPIDADVSAAISGASSLLVKDGLGTLLLSSPSSSYTGNTLLRRGTLLVGADAPNGGVGITGALGNSTATVELGDVSSGENRAILTQAAVTIGRNIRVGNHPGAPMLGGNSSGASLFSGNIELNKATALTAAAGTVEFSGALTGSGGVVKVGAGQTVLSNSGNSFSGDTAIRQGTLIVAANAPSGTNGALGNAATDILLGDTVIPLVEVRAASFGGVGGSFNPTGGANGRGQLTGMSTSCDSISVSIGNRVLVKGESGANAIRNGIYQVVSNGVWDRAAEFDEDGELLHGTQVKVAAGKVNSGKIFFLQNLGASQINSTPLDWQEGATNPNVALLTGGAVTLGRNIVITDNKSTGTSTLGGSTAHASTFAGTVTLNKNTVFTAATDGTVSFTGIVSGSGGITKTGNGTVFLGTTNTYDGLTTINAGTVKLGHANALGTTTNGTTVNGGTLDLNAFTPPANEVVTISGTGVDGKGALINTVRDIYDGVSRLVLAGDATIGGTHRFDLGRNGGAITGGTHTLTKTGTNYVAITTGNVTLGNLIVDEGTVSVEVSSGLGNATGAYSATVNPLGTLQYWSVSGITNSKPLVLNGGKLFNGNGPNTHAGSLTLNAIANTIETNANYAPPGTGAPVGYLTITGKLTGSGGFTKTGPKDLILNNSANDYQGDTIVSAGRLLVNNTSGSGTGSGNVVVNGGLLGGNGIIGGNVTVNAAGMISAGNSPGYLTILGDYTQSGTMLVEIGGEEQGVDYDWLSIEGQATLAGTIDIQYVGGFTPSDASSFDILLAKGGITNADLSGVVFTFAGMELNASIVSVSGGGEVLRLGTAEAVAIPEPASLVLALLAGVGPVAFLWRRRCVSPRLERS